MSNELVARNTSVGKHGTYSYSELPATSYHVAGADYFEEMMNVGLAAMLLSDLDKHCHDSNCKKLSVTIELLMMLLKQEKNFEGTFMQLVQVLQNRWEIYKRNKEMEEFSGVSEDMKGPA